MTSNIVSMSGDSKNMAAPISLFVHVRSCSFQAIPSKARAGALSMGLFQYRFAGIPGQAGILTAGRERKGLAWGQALSMPAMGIGTPNA